MSAPIPDELACQEVVELVTEFLEEKLSPEERTRFEMHLCFCEPCRTYLQQMRDVIRNARKLGGETLPPGAKEALLLAFRSWKRGPGGELP